MVIEDGSYLINIDNYQHKLTLQGERYTLDDKIVGNWLLLGEVLTLYKDLDMSVVLVLGLSTGIATIGDTSELKRFTIWKL